MVGDKARIRHKVNKPDARDGGAVPDPQRGANANTANIHGAKRLSKEMSSDA